MKAHGTSGWTIAVAETASTCTIFCAFRARSCRLGSQPAWPVPPDRHAMRNEAPGDPGWTRTLFARSRGRPAWSLAVAKDAVVSSSMPCLPQLTVEIAQDARPCERAPAPASHELPDQAWFEQRARFVQRVRRSLLSGNEIRLLREFKLLRQNQISMFGY